MSRSTASLPHPPPNTPPRHQTNSLPSRNPPNLSPNTRDRHLKQILETHRADRHRIQTRHDEATGDLTEKLRHALSEVRRIEREFRNFQNGANARLADVLAENERLRLRVAQLENHQKPRTATATGNKENRSPLSPLNANVPLTSKHGDRETVGISQQATKKDEKMNKDTFPKRETMKPSERELEVERLREAARDSRRLRVPRRRSLRVLRREDCSLKTRSEVSKQSEGKPEKREHEERRSIRLVRSLSRKWSTCF